MLALTWVLSCFIYSNLWTFILSCHCKADSADTDLDNYFIEQAGGDLSIAREQMEESNSALVSQNMELQLLLSDQEDARVSVKLISLQSHQV